MSPTDEAGEQWLATIREMRLGLERDWERAQDSLATLVRTEVAQGLAAAFFEQKRPWQRSDRLLTMIDSGALDHGAFIQKTPDMLAFYRRLLMAFEQEPA